MVEFYVEPNTTTIPLGRQGENLARTIYFELSELISNYGEGTATLVYLRSKDSAPYVCDTTQSGIMLSWTPTDTDTAYAGAGKCELRWVVGETLAKSIVYRTSVTESITGDSTVPSEYESWYKALLEHISEYEIASDQIETNTRNIATNTNDIAVLNGRVDEITTLPEGSTTGDAELADIRVGADGTIYPNAGEAVRTQINDVKSAFALFQDNISACSAGITALQFQSAANTAGVADLRAYLGLYDSDVVGVQVDYKNKTYKRLGAASGLNGGSDFDQFPMFGGRKRCNVANDGTINAWYGDGTYKEDGSNGQVMVYQPAFWYLVAPVEYEKQSTGVGYHLRKANYYVSGKARAGFRLHPAFFDASGNEVDHIFFSAFRGSIYDTSAKAYIKDDAQVCDAGTDLFCSISGVKPASGYNQNLTRTSIEQMAQNRGAGWHGDTIKATSANQLLMLIEYAGNLQTAIERGVVDIPWTGLASDDTSSYAVNTGGTSALGNATGHADSSTQQINGQILTNTTNGKRSISYRGMEDPWGNMWDFVYGLNFYYESGKPFLGYVCKDFNFAESKQTDNYESIGFTLPSENGYISAMGYSTKFDWLFLPSEVNGDSALPIGDYYYQNNTWNGYRIALLGGSWPYGVFAGGFYWRVSYGIGYRYRVVGGRLVYVPTAKA